jgi:hypothetical protein
LAKKEVENLFNLLLECNKRKILVLGGNYDPLGISAEVALKIGGPLFPIGCDRTSPAGPYPGNFFSYEGYSFLGVEGSNPINGLFPGERSEDEIKWALSKAQEKAGRTDPTTTVVVSHVPPWGGGTRDQLGMFGLPTAYWGKHVGSTALKEFLDEKRPLLTICGHVHEGVGTTVFYWDNADTKPEITDLRMDPVSYRLALFTRRNARRMPTICVNHGTLEHWSYMRYRIAEIGDCIAVEIARRRLGGRDALTRMADRLTGKGNKVVYDKIIDPNNVLHDLVDS